MTGPKVIELEADTYYWCSCGKSANIPFCDGSHKGTKDKPVEFTIDETKKVALCQCRKTANAPYCDGTHKDL